MLNPQTLDENLLDNPHNFANYLKSISISTLNYSNLQLFVPLTPHLQLFYRKTFKLFIKSHLFIRQHLFEIQESLQCEPP